MFAIVSSLKQDGFRTLCCQLRGNFIKRGIKSSVAQNTTLLMLVSAFAARTTSPTFSNTMRRDAMVENCSNMRFLQRVVPANKFYGYSKCRFDSAFCTKKVGKASGET